MENKNIVELAQQGEHNLFKAIAFIQVQYLAEEIWHKELTDEEICELIENVQYDNEDLLNELQDRLSHYLDSDELTIL